MKRIHLGLAREAKLTLSKTSKTFTKFCKYSPTSLDILEIIDQHKYMLTFELYNLANELYYNKNGDYIGFSVPLLRKYHTLYYRLRNNDGIDKNLIAKQIVQVVDELASIGLNYYDIHDCNIMIGPRNEFKVIDLDGVERGITPVSKLYTINNFWELMFEMYVFYFLPTYPVCVSRALAYEKIDEYFSKEFLEYLYAVMIDNKEIVDIHLGSYLHEFHDEEKILNLSQKMQQKY